MSKKAGPVSFNKAFYVSKETHTPKWHVIDAGGKILGRLATEVVETLRGKDKAFYTPHADSGDYVVVINADKIKLTGNKMTDKVYLSYSGWMGGQKSRSPQDIIEKHPTALLERAVKGMLPNNRLSRQIIKKLKVYTGSKHPHIAQV